MIVRDEAASVEVLAIVEKYEVFVRYLYPILQNAPRRHGVLRDAVLTLLFEPIGGLYHAARSRQVSRLHVVDAVFATLRSHMRFMASAAIRILTSRQHQVALGLLAEPGRMLGAWQKKLATSSTAPRSPGRSGPAILGAVGRGQVG